MKKHVARDLKSFFDPYKPQIEFPANNPVELRWKMKFPIFIVDRAPVNPFNNYNSTLHLSS